MFVVRINALSVIFFALIVTCSVSVVAFIAFIAFIAFVSFVSFVSFVAFIITHVVTFVFIFGLGTNTERCSVR